jgi:RNA polymerase sigma-70 factor (ECF subfamily)
MEEMKKTYWKENLTMSQGTPVEQEGSPPNLETIMTRHYASEYRLAVSILYDPHEAEDIAQETFIAVSINLDDFRGDADIKTWLFSIVINRARGNLRKRKTQRALKNVLQSVQRLVPFPKEPEEAALETEKDEQLWQVVDSFGDKHRIPIILRYVHQLPISEIAKILDVKEGTVHSRLFYAHQKIRSKLKRIGFPTLEDQEAAR